METGSRPVSTAQLVEAALRGAVDRVFTAELPREVRLSVLGEPRVNVVPRFDQPGRAYVTISFEIVQELR